MKLNRNDRQPYRQDDRERVATKERSAGYSKEEYYQISLRQNIPLRCPILGKCYRAVQTKYEMGLRLGGSDMSVDEFMNSEGIKENPEDFVRAIQKPSFSYSHDVFTSVSNVCPEVTLFDPDYLPLHFKQSAFKDAAYYKETKSFEAEPAHYSECAEFCKYQLQEIAIRKAAGHKRRKRSHISQQMRFEIFQRDGFRCHYCRRHKSELHKGVHLTLDHRKPYGDGGEDSFENLVTACSECNSGKSNKIINNI